MTLPTQSASVLTKSLQDAPDSANDIIRNAMNKSA
jgi:hypothetical protein